MKFEKIIKCIQVNDLDNAKNLLIKFLRKNPTHIQALNTYGIILLKTNNIEQGVKYLKRSLKIKNDQNDVLKNIIIALQQLEKYQEAIDLCNEYQKLCDAELQFKLGYFYNKENFFSLAIDKYKSIEDEYQDKISLYYNLAISYENNNQCNDAISYYKKVIDLDSKHRNAIFNLSVLYLYSNKFKLGWQQFDSRFLFEENKIDLDIELLNGISCSKKNILIVFEQGIGDHILFSTILPSLDFDKNNFFIKIDPRLKSFIKRKFKKINFFDNKSSKNIDYYIPVGNLGKQYRNDINSFLDVDYKWSADMKLLDSFKSKLPKNRIICGISWSSQNKYLGKHKLLDIKKIIKNINIDNIVFVNLQYGDVDNLICEIKNELGIEIIDYDFDKFNDIENLAALCRCCNFIITTSNITAHLAGILKVRTFVVPPKIHGKLWYWGNIINRRSLWYETISIIENDSDIQLSSKIHDLIIEDQLNII